MKLIHLLAVLLLIFTLVACSSQPSPTSQSGVTSTQSDTPGAYPPISSNTPNGTSAYPVGGQPSQPTSGYPAPQDKGSNLTAQASITPDPSKATVTGVLLIKGKPAANISLYLAKVLKDASGKEITLSLDKSASPSATTDSEGKFVFNNVPLDTYGLIQDNGILSFALTKPGSTQDQIRVIVTSAQLTDIGSLDYDQLPGS